MKIGIEAQRLFRVEKHGLEVVALELIRNLQEIDKVNDYTIFVRKGLDNKCVHETENFKICEIDSNSFPDWEQIKLPRALKKEKIQLLHCTGNTAPIFTSVPLILTLHDIIFLEKLKYQGNSYQYIGNLYRKFIVPLILKKCKKIITVSNFEKQQIIAHTSVDKNKVDVVYNATNSGFKQLEEKDLLKTKELYNLPDKFILFFGNTAAKKNTQNTILGYIHYASRAENPIQLIIAGTFKDYVLKLLSELNLSSEIRDYITVIDYIPFNEQPKIYNLATLFLYTSLRESFGMPILESLACGTPVVTSNTSSMPEIAKDAAILVNPHKPEEVGMGIDEVLKSESLYKDLKEKGLARAKEFNWVTCAQQVLTKYNEILDESNIP